MPYTIQWEPHGACKTFSGHLSEQEFVQSSSDISADERFDELRYVISDYTAVSSHGVTSHGMDLVAAIRLGAWITNPHIRSVVVAGDTSAGSIGALARLQPLLRPEDTSLFATQEEARSWLRQQPELRRSSRARRF